MKLFFTPWFIVKYTFFVFLLTNNFVVEKCSFSLVEKLCIVPRKIRVQFPTISVFSDIFFFFFLQNLFLFCFIFLFYSNKRYKIPKIQIFNLWCSNVNTAAWKSYLPTGERYWGSIPVGLSVFKNFFSFLNDFPPFFE